LVKIKGLHAELVGVHRNGLMRVATKSRHGIVAHQTLGFEDSQVEMVLYLLSRKEDCPEERADFCSRAHHKCKHQRFASYGTSKCSHISWLCWRCSGSCIAKS